MASIILPSRWQQQPTGPVEIDWRNPLTQGMAHCYLGGDSYHINLVTRGQDGTQTGRMGSAARPDGLATAGTGSTYLRNTTRAPTTLPLSIGVVAGGRPNGYGPILSSFTPGSVGMAAAFVGSDFAGDAFPEYRIDFDSGVILSDKDARSSLVNTTRPYVCRSFSSTDHALIVGQRITADTSTRKVVAASAQVGLGYYAGHNYAVGRLANTAWFTLAAMWYRGLSDAEAFEFNAAPFQIFVPRRNVLYFSAGSPPTGATLDLSKTQEDHTVSSQSKIIVVGNSSSVLEDNTLSSNSKVKVSGNASIQENENTLSSNSFILVKASANNSQEDQTLSASTGSSAGLNLTTTQEDSTLSSLSEVLVKANSTSTQEDSTLSSLSEVLVKANSTSTQEDNTVTTNSKVKVSGVATSAQEDDAAYFAAKITVKTNLLTSNHDNTLVSDSTVKVKASTNTVVEGDISNASITVVNQGEFSLSVTQDDNTSSSFATLLVSGSAGTISEDDSSVSSVKVLVDAAATAAQSEDSVSSAAKVLINAVSSSQSSDDTISSAAKVLINAVSSSQSSDDTISSAAKVLIKATSTASQEDSITATVVIGNVPVSAVLNSSQSDNNVSSSLNLGPTPAGLFLTAVQEDNITSSTAKVLVKSTLSSNQDSNTVSSAVMAYITSQVSVAQSDTVSSNAALRIVAQSTSTQSNSMSAQASVFTPGSGGVIFTQNDQILTANIYYPRAKSVEDTTIVAEKLESIVVSPANETVIIS